MARRSLACLVRPGEGGRLGRLRGPLRPAPLPRGPRRARLWQWGSAPTPGPCAPREGGHRAASASPAKGERERERGIDAVPSWVPGPIGREPGVQVGIRRHTRLPSGYTRAGTVSVPGGAPDDDLPAPARVASRSGFPAPSVRGRAAGTSPAGPRRAGELMRRRPGACDGPSTGQATYSGQMTYRVGWGRGLGGGARRPPVRRTLAARLRADDHRASGSAAHSAGGAPWRPAKASANGRETRRRKKHRRVCTTLATSCGRCSMRAPSRPSCSTRRARSCWPTTSCHRSRASRRARSSGSGSATCWAACTRTRPRTGAAPRRSAPCAARTPRSSRRPRPAGRWSRTTASRARRASRPWRWTCACGLRRSPSGRAASRSSRCAT